MKSIIFSIFFFSSVFVWAQNADPAQSVGRAWGSVNGMTMFRGNPTRTFYGTGPIERTPPQVLWKYPERPMCSSSCVGKSCSQWCGTGWTGQPVVWERPDGITEVIFGAYDRKVHFVNALTGKPTRKPFTTGDLIKGSVTLDPDGFPLLYFGSRDNKYRILALDSEPVREIFALDGHAVPRQIWNDDWDGNGAIVADRLFIGGENSWFHIVKLNRRLDSQGKVSIQPELEVQMPGWTEDMRKLVGDSMISIESSPAVFRDRVYWTNSGGMVIGVDWTQARNKTAPIVFSFWAGDDIDGSPVVDEEGFLYVAVEYELDGGRAHRASGKRVKEVGQLIKLNPYNSQNPVVWSVKIPPRGGGDGGIWSTPALDIQRDAVIVTTHPGDLLIVDRKTGEEIWRHRLGTHEWSSPAVIGNQLLVGRCGSPGLQLFDLPDRFSSTQLPVSVWETTGRPAGCVESTPAVWKGRIYVGSRDGYFYGFGPGPQQNPN